MKFKETLNELKSKYPFHYAICMMTEEDQRLLKASVFEDIPRYGFNMEEVREIWENMKDEWLRNLHTDFID